MQTGDGNTTTMDNNTTTLANLESDSGTDIFFWVTLACTLELIISSCCNVVALGVMKKCRKIPTSIRYLSINFLAAMLLASCNTLIHSTARFTIGPSGDYRIVIDSRTFFTSMFISLTWCSLCFLTLERFVALMFPLNFAKYVSKATISFTIASVWVFNILSPTLIFILNWLNICGEYDYVNSCDRFALFHSNRMFMLSQLCLYGCVTVAVYTKISLIIRRHNREIDALTINNQNASTNNSAISRTLQSTKVIVAIILSFIILQSPVLLTVLIFELRPDLQQPQVRSLLFSTIFVFGEINTYFTLYFYVWKFQECRMNFYRMLAKLSDRYRVEAETLHRDVFNIVSTSVTKSDNAHCTNM